MELTQEQQDLVEKNIKLVYSVATKLNVLKNEDAIQEGIMGLCVASSRYKEDLSKFSTFAVKYIKGYILTYLTYDKIIRPHRHDGKFVYSEICFIDDDNLLNVQGAMGLIDLENDIREIMLKLDDASKMIFQMMVEGYTQIQMSKKMGCTQASVCRKIKQIKGLPFDSVTEFETVLFSFLFSRSINRREQYSSASRECNVTKTSGDQVAVTLDDRVFLTVAK